MSNKIESNKITKKKVNWITAFFFVCEEIKKEEEETNARILKSMRKEKR